MLSTTQTVANVVSEHSECAEVFQRHRIDFCCKGELSVEAAAQQRGLDVDLLMRELGQSITARRDPSNFTAKGLETRALIEHIVGKHHSYLRTALPFLRPLAAKVARVHGDHNPKLRELNDATSELCEALLPHLDDEEQSLFPMLRQNRARDAQQIQDALAAMLEEHYAVARLLERIRAAADDFTLPDWACNSYRALFAELQELERDTFLHVHLENHVLAPRFTRAATVQGSPCATGFSLTREAAELRKSPAYEGSGHGAKTLVRKPDARVTLIALRKGARIIEHKTEHSIMIQALEGRVQVNTPQETVEIPTLGVLFLEAGVPHDVIAHQDSTVLLTIHWNAPSGGATTH